MDLLEEVSEASYNAHFVDLFVRVSNALAVGMLFAAGVTYGRCVGRSPWALGLSMVVLGGGLVALTMALGG